jgi:hypothetical protein
MGSHDRSHKVSLIFLSLSPLHLLTSLNFPPVLLPPPLPRYVILSTDARLSILSCRQPWPLTSSPAAGNRKKALNERPIPLSDRHSPLAYILRNSSRTCCVTIRLLESVETALTSTTRKSRRSVSSISSLFLRELPLPVYLRRSDVVLRAVWWLCALLVTVFDARPSPSSFSSSFCSRLPAPPSAALLPLAVHLDRRCPRRNPLPLDLSDPCFWLTSVRQG